MNKREDKCERPRLTLRSPRFLSCCISEVPGLTQCEVAVSSVPAAMRLNYSTWQVSAHGV